MPEHTSNDSATTALPVTRPDHVHIANQGGNSAQPVDLEQMKEINDGEQAAQRRESERRDRPDAQ